MGSRTSSQGEPLDSGARMEVASRSEGLGFWLKRYLSAGVRSRAWDVLRALEV